MRVTSAQIDKCFGFETSVERSQGALMAAKVVCHCLAALTEL